MSSHMEIYAFAGQELIAWGSVASVASILKNEQNQTDKEITLLFDGTTGQQIDLDLSGSVEDVQNRYGTPSDSPPAEGSSSPRKGRGRPKLGVAGREVTLLPRHWEWLDTQRGGASAVLRRLVDQERKAGAGEDQVRQAQDSAQRFMSSMAGNLPGFEEAARALYAREEGRFKQETSGWPADIRDCARRYAEPALK